MVYAQMSPIIKDLHIFLLSSDNSWLEGSSIISMICCISIDWETVVFDAPGGVSKL